MSHSPVRTAATSSPVLRALRAGLLGGLALSSLPLLAAPTPAAGTVKPDGPVASYTGSLPGANPTVTCSAATCDDYALNLQLPADWKALHPNSTVSVTVKAASANDDYDMRVLRGTATVVSGAVAGDENVSFAAESGTQALTVRVYPFTSTGGTYTTTITLNTGDSGGGSSSGGSSSGGSSSGGSTGNGRCLSDGIAKELGCDKVVVIAVIDSNINPYHWDYLGAKMPQHLDSDPNNNLPLSQDPSTWIKGYPSGSAFKSFTALPLTLKPNDGSTTSASLHTADIAQWSKIRISEGTLNKDVNMYWFPGTKIIGHVAFSGASVGDPATTSVTGPSTGPLDTWAADSHGIGTSSVSAGAIHGSCPNCVLVYVHGTSEQANQWVSRQNWIDLQSNSWGLSFTGAARDRIYAGSDTKLQKRVTERGQSIFFSAGNGVENAFVVTNPTLASSQEGPDWIITAGAIAPNGSSYSGHGKPADISSIGSGYKSAYGGNGTVTAEGDFSGTSNSTPVLAGIYGEALYRIRLRLGGANRMQALGVIASGVAGCGTANAGCAMADGKLTVHELREALYSAARYTPQGTNVGGVATLPATENQKELEYLAEGHGSYFGRLNGDAAYNAEIQRIVDTVFGISFTAQTADQKNWFIADSLCRQSIWGSWNFGEDKRGPAPAADPAWPVRSYYTNGCPATLPILVMLEKTYAGQFTSLDTQAGDRDDDAVADAGDNCPDNANTDQLDADTDGIGDVCDPTPFPVLAPSPFTFIERSNVPVNSFVTSEAVTLAGFTGSLPITVSAGLQYSVNGAAFTASAGSIAAGQKLTLRHASAAAENTAKESTVSVGSGTGVYSTVFRSVTTTIDRSPDAFDFGSQQNVAPGTVVESELRTPAGFDLASISPGPGLAYRINGGEWTTAKGTLRPGETLQVRHTSNSGSLGYTKSYLNVGGVSGYFTTRTRK